MNLSTDFLQIHFKKILIANCAIILLTALIINLNFENAYLLLLKILLMVVSVLLIPGFSLINLIYRDNEFGVVEILAYSFGASLAFVAGTVFIINYILVSNYITLAYYIIALCIILVNIYLLLKK